jgi:transcription elongation factor
MSAVTVDEATLLVKSALKPSIFNSVPGVACDVLDVALKVYVDAFKAQEVAAVEASRPLQVGDLVRILVGVSRGGNRMRPVGAVSTIADVRGDLFTVSGNYYKAEDLERVNA